MCGEHRAAPASGAPASCRCAVSPSGGRGHHRRRCAGNEPVRVHTHHTSTVCTSRARTTRHNTPATKNYKHGGKCSSVAERPGSPNHRAPVQPRVAVRDSQRKQTHTRTLELLRPIGSATNNTTQPRSNDYALRRRQTPQVRLPPPLPRHAPHRAATASFSPMLRCPQPRDPPPCVRTRDRLHLPVTAWLLCASRPPTRVSSPHVDACSECWVPVFFFWGAKAVTRKAVTCCGLTLQERVARRPLTTWRRRVLEVALRR